MIRFDITRYTPDAATRRVVVTPHEQADVEWRGGQEVPEQPNARDYTLGEAVQVRFVRSTLPKTEWLTVSAQYFNMASGKGSSAPSVTNFEMGSGTH